MFMEQKIHGKQYIYNYNNYCSPLSYIQ